MLTDEKILEKGYHEFKPTRFHHQGIEKCFQKRFDDDTGKRYFIDIHKWSPMTHPHTGETYGPSYEYSVQMYSKDKHNAVDFLFHSDWELEEVEEHLKTLFETGMYDYYERWDEN